MQRRPERISSLVVERGLYVLRYLGTATGDCPTIFVRSSPGDDHAVTVVPFPGETAGRLSAPGTVMVIVADQPSTLQITAQAASPTGSLIAELKLEPLRAEPKADDVASLGTGVQTPVLPPAAALVVPEMAGQADAEDVRVMAHVARRGDVTSIDGAWVGGPDAPSPLEALSLACSASVGDLRFQVLAAGETRWSEWMPSGGLGGSRGRSTPLVGVRLRLVPAAGSGVVLVGEALFLGSAILRKEGQELEFRSAAGSDPLLGFRLEARRETTTRETRPSVVSAPSQPGRVRVFRATGRRAG